MSENEKKEVKTACEVEVNAPTAAAEAEQLGEEIGRSFGRFIYLLVTEYGDDLIKWFCKSGNEKLPDDIKKMTVEEVFNKILKE